MATFSLNTTIKIEVGIAVTVVASGPGATISYSVPADHYAIVSVNTPGQNFNINGAVFNTSGVVTGVHVGPGQVITVTASNAGERLSIAGTVFKNSP